MSFWAEDPELFIHKGQDGIVHVLRCKKEAATSWSSSMLMKPEDFIDEGAVADLRSLTRGCYDWDKHKYEALIDYIYPRHLLVNCHGSVIVELESDEKSVLALLFNLFFLLFKWLLVNLFHIKKKAAAVVYMRALDILDMGCYGPGPDHPGQSVPVRTIKYLQDGTIVQTEPTPNEMKLSKEVEALQQELLLGKEKIEVELAKEMNLTEELARKSKEVETSQQLLAKEKTEKDVLIKRVSELEESANNKNCGSTTAAPLPAVRIYTKADTRFSLSIRDGEQVIFRPNDKSDACQYWMKDEKYGASVKDVCGYPSYALVNKFTGQALKPSSAGNKPVELVRYNPNVLDESILWSEVDLGDGYRAIRKATDPSLNLDGSLATGGVGDGTIVHLWNWWSGDNQKWNMVPHT